MKDRLISHFNFVKLPLLCITITGKVGFTDIIQASKRVEDLDLTVDELQNIIVEGDKDHDERLSYTEFRNVLTSNPGGTLAQIAANLTSGQKDAHIIFKALDTSDTGIITFRYSIGDTLRFRTVLIVS